MDDPVKGEGRMITDASGVTRREGGILGMWGNIFPERNGCNEQRVIAHRTYPTSGIFLIFFLSHCGKRC